MTVFRSPLATAIWWAWAAFALANLIDLAVQGRDRFSLEAALGVLLVTGVVYAVARRPRIVAGADGLTIVNPLRDHTVPWPAVTAVEAAELLRVRCQWPAGSRVIYAWAVHSSRRGQVIARARPAPPGRTYPPPGAAGWRSGGDVPAFEPRLDAGRVVADLAERAARARGADGDGAIAADPQAPARPTARWHWPSVAAILVPAVALAVLVAT